MAVVETAGAGLRAVELGANAVQLRAPRSTVRRLEEEARLLVRDARVPVLISSRCDVALAAGAAGVNLPESDIPASDARRLLGPRLIGRSIHSLEGAQRAQEDGADFVVFGPVWATPSHPDAAPRGVDALAEVARAIDIPVIAIGGVTRERARECIAAGAAGYAAISLFR